MLRFQRTGHAVLLLILSIILMSCRTAEQMQDRTNDETAIRAVIAANEEAGNKRDYEGVAATYAPDGDMMRYDGPIATGREAIRQVIERALENTPTTSRGTFDVQSIRFIHVDVAIVESILRWSEGPLSEERATLVVARQNGEWLIAAARCLPAVQ